MIFSEMQLQRIIVEVVLGLVVLIAIADEAALMLVPAMHIKLIITVKTLTTEATYRMSSESTLVDGAWVVVAFLHVLLQLFIREQLLLMCEDFLVPYTKIAQLFVMDLDMFTQARPPSTRFITRSIRAVIAQK